MKRLLACGLALVLAVSGAVHAGIAVGELPPDQLGNNQQGDPIRVSGYRKRMVIAFTVDAARVSVIGVFYGGQDHETFLQQDTPEE